MTNTVSHVVGWEALDSRGRPTVACRVELSDGSSGVAIVPSGASAGSHEAVELRDGGARYAGRGVLRAVGHVNGVLREIAVGCSPDQVDAALATTDPSPDFSTIGANATLAVSIATAIADAESAGAHLARHLSGAGPLSIPMPMVNVISGGAHAGGILDVQDFLFLPYGAGSFGEAIEWSVGVRDAATRIAQQRGLAGAQLVADEGGLGVALASNRDALELLTAAIESAGLVAGVNAGIAIDVAASEFFRDGRYHFAIEDRWLSSAELSEELVSWCDEYAIVSIEDGMAEDDWDGWAALTSRLGDRIELVGDDLFVTHSDRLARGIRDSVANSVLVKVNQNGLLSGANAVLDQAHSAGYRTVVSARSGETENSWLSDLAVGWRASQIKVGSTHRSERSAKWNRLLELEATEPTTFQGPWFQAADRAASPRERASV
jgi:enolase